MKHQTESKEYIYIILYSGNEYLIKSDNMLHNSSLVLKSTFSKQSSLSVCFILKHKSIHYNNQKHIFSCYVRFVSNIISKKHTPKHR
jgi:hypothetical protein